MFLGASCVDQASYHERDEASESIPTRPARARTPVLSPVPSQLAVTIVEPDRGLAAQDDDEFLACVVEVVVAVSAFRLKLLDRSPKSTTARDIPAHSRR